MPKFREGEKKRPKSECRKKNLKTLSVENISSQIKTLHSPIANMSAENTEVKKEMSADAGGGTLGDLLL